MECTTLDNSNHLYWKWNHKKNGLLDDTTKWDFEINNPNLEFPSHDFNMLVSGQFNNKIRKGFNKVKKKI